MLRVTPRDARPPAYAILHFTYYVRQRTLERGNTLPYSVRIGELWRRTMGLSERLTYMLRLLANYTGCRVFIYAEDFAARWALESAFVADTYFFDNPIISEAEWAVNPRSTRRLFVRWPHEHHLKRWNDWRLPFKEADRLAGAVVPCEAGHWRPTDYTRVMACVRQDEYRTLPPRQAESETPPAAEEA